jgi:hypothetical protein
MGPFSKSFRFFILAMVCTMVCTPGQRSGFAQSTNSGDLRGTVTDSTGALLPGVTVTITNKNTQVTKVLTTNQDGLYDSGSIVVGNYQVRFSLTGFTSFERSSVTLQVGTSTVNASLKVGSTQDQVVVNTDIPLLKTESGEQSTTLEANQMAGLPNVGQDWENFAILIPGAAGTSNANPGQEISANGNLPYSNVLADGSSTTLSHSQNSDVDVFETVSEVQISTSAFSAQYGIGGIIFNQISKGGTDKFHGSAYDYFQNTALNAAEYGFGNPVTVAPIHFNNFGGSIGGPVALPFLNLKKKAFFFFDYDQTINHSNAQSYNSIPTPATMAGNFSGQPTLYDPTTQTIAHDAAGNPYPVRKSFQSEYGSNAIPSGLFDTLAAKFQQFYPTPGHTVAGSQFVNGNLGADGIISNNLFSSIAESVPFRKYFGRFDYDISPKNRVTISVTQRDTPTLYPSAVTASPIGYQILDIESYNPQVTDVWSISDRTINEARFGYTYQGNFWDDLEQNQGYAAQLGFQAAKADEIPAVQFITNYPYAWIEPETSGFYKENVFDPSDVVTMIRGKHVIHFGGEVAFYRENSTVDGNVNAGTYQFSGQYTQQWTVNPTTGIAAPNSSTGADYADFLLGYAQNWNAGITPEYGARLKAPQMFIQDDYKIRPNFTLNVGVRYQIRHGWNEINGNEDSFDPTVVNPATSTLGAIWYGSTAANGRKSLEANSFSTVLPRVGFSWLPYPNMTVRGGFGVYAYNLSLDTYGGGMGAPFGSSGSYTDPTNGITPATQLDGTGTVFTTGAPLPYSAASTSPTRFNGQSVGYTQFHTPTPEIYQWNLSTQNQIGANMVFELAYVASHGFNLNFPMDINQVPATKLSANDITQEPYPQYQAITGSPNNGISNYNSLQVSVNRRLAQGLSFNFNYVWSHFLDDQDSGGRGGSGGPQTYQIANTAANYSNSNFDTRNAFKGNLLYQLPFGMGRQFLNKNRLLDEAIGGWQVSSTMLFSSGNPFTVSSGQSTYAQGGGAFPNSTGISTTPAGGHTLAEWYNPAAFSLPANGTFGDVRRNTVYGPALNLVNLSAGKKFDLYKQVKLQIRADATNAFNHPSFGVPNDTLTATGGQQPGGAYGATAGGSQQITTTTVGGRTVQLGAHLEF